MMRTSDPDNEEGVSVIVGTLLLILVAVTAAMGFALMVSELQKQEIVRRSHQQAVEHEKLRIMNIVLTNSQEEWAGSSDMDWKNMSDWTSNPNSPCHFDASNCSITDISRENWINYCWNNWSSINITVLNLNTEPSSIISVAINDKFSKKVTNVARIRIPGAKINEPPIHLSFVSDFGNDTTLIVPYDSEIRIKIVTSLYNIFESTFRPPAPAVRAKTEIEHLGTIEREILVLDGSESMDDGHIVRYRWRISNSSGPIGEELEGAIVRKIFRASDLYNTTSFTVQLQVSDETGMTATSPSVTIPASRRYAPPVRMMLETKNVNPGSPNPDRIDVTLLDAFNEGVDNIDVIFNVIDGNVTLDTYHSLSGNADEHGVAATNVTSGTGTVRIWVEGLTRYVAIA